jgi:hypothetical protein
MFAFWWNFIMWIPTCIAPGGLLLVIGFVDLAIVIALAVGVGYQSTYLPHSKSACSNAAEWQVPKNGNESWFQAVALAHNASYPKPDDYCGDYVEIWIIGVAMVSV